VVFAASNSNTVAGAAPDLNRLPNSPILLPSRTGTSNVSKLHQVEGGAKIEPTQGGDFRILAYLMASLRAGNLSGIRKVTSNFSQCDIFVRSAAKTGRPRSLRTSSGFVPWRNRDTLTAQVVQ